jgi:hypothetical protein
LIYGKKRAPKNNSSIVEESYERECRKATKSHALSPVNNKKISVLSEEIIDNKKMKRIKMGKERFQ